MSEVIKATDEISIVLVDDGDTGTGLSNLTPQYYLSTSSSSAIGGTWSNTPPAFESGKYYWTRQLIAYDDGTTAYSTAVYDAGLTEAAQNSTDAQDTAESTLIYDHEYTIVNGNANFTAYVYRGGEDVKLEFAPGAFTWYLKTEAGMTYQGNGYTISIPLTSCGFGAEVIGYFTI